MLASLRQLYWRLKYRPGRRVTFGWGYDGFTEIIVVENRLATAGTLVYCERDVDSRAEPREFGPPREETVPDMVRRLTTYPDIKLTPEQLQVRWEMRPRWRTHGHCPRCRYNLTGNVSGVCPECGTPR